MEKICETFLSSVTQFVTKQLKNGEQLRPRSRSNLGKLRYKPKQAASISDDEIMKDLDEMSEMQQKQSSSRSRSRSKTRARSTSKGKKSRSRSRAAQKVKKIGRISKKSSRKIKRGVRSRSKTRKM